MILYTGSKFELLAIARKKKTDKYFLNRRKRFKNIPNLSQYSPPEVGSLWANR